MGSDESHFNLSLIVRDKVTRQCLQTTTFFEEKGESRRGIESIEALQLTSLTPLPLGHTVSLSLSLSLSLSPYIHNTCARVFVCVW